jgi:hypothetical protein
MNLDIRHYTEYVLVSFIKINGQEYRRESLFSILQALADVDGIRTGLELPDTSPLLKLFRELEVIHESAFMGAYPGPKFEEFCEAVGYILPEKTNEG